MLEFSWWWYLFEWAVLPVFVWQTWVSFRHQGKDEFSGDKFWTMLYSTLAIVGMLRREWWLLHGVEPFARMVVKCKGIYPLEGTPFGQAWWVFLLEILSWTFMAYEVLLCVTRDKWKSALCFAIAAFWGARLQFTDAWLNDTFRVELIDFVTSPTFR